MLQQISFIIGLALFISLGITVIAADKKNTVNRIFFLVTLIGCMWLSVNFLVDVWKDNSIALLFSKLDFALSLPSCYIFALFCWYFPKPIYNLKRSLQVFIIALIIAFSVIVFVSNWVVYGVKYISSGYEVLYGKMIIPYFLLIGILVCAGLLIQILKFKKLTGNAKKQLITSFIGICILIIIPIVTNTLLPILYPNIPLITRLGYVGIILWGLITAYAIFSQGILNTKALAAELAFGLLLIIQVIQIFTSTSTSILVMRLLFFVLILYFGYLLIQTLKREVVYRKRIEVISNNLRYANNRLREVDAMKTEFVSMASHELLTPISAIEGYLSMIVDEHLVRIDDPKANKYITSVYRSSKRLARLVADLLNVSRIEEGRLLVEKKVVNVVELMQQTVDELKFKAAEKQVKLSFVSRLDPNYINTFGDADKIKEVLVNLSGNGIKYNKAGGQVVLSAQLWPTQTVEQRWHAMAHTVIDKGRFGQGALQRIVNSAYTQMVGEQQIVIAIQDTGVGIAYEDIGKLFQKFSRVGDWSTQETPGTGLGLYVSKALIEMHHGKIWVESAGVGKGSTFFFSLPLASYQQNIKQMDSQVPAQKNMKGLARMGGGPVGKV